MFKELDPLLHSQLRLAIMSLLLSIVEADFVFIKEQTGATAGNLSVQIEKLRVAEYIEVNKFIKGRTTCTMCKISEKGIEAFNQYVQDLRSYINSNSSD